MSLQIFFAAKPQNLPAGVANLLTRLDSSISRHIVLTSCHYASAGALNAPKTALSRTFCFPRITVFVLKFVLVTGQVEEAEITATTIAEARSISLSIFRPVLMLGPPRAATKSSISYFVMKRW